MRKRLLKENRYWGRADIERVYKEAVKLCGELNIPVIRRPTNSCRKCGRTKFGWCECE